MIRIKKTICVVCGRTIPVPITNICRKHFKLMLFFTEGKENLTTLESQKKFSPRPTRAFRLKKKLETVHR
jgi:hypothetical protein